MLHVVQNFSRTGNPLITVSICRGGECFRYSSRALSKAVIGSRRRGKIPGSDKCVDTKLAKEHARKTAAKTCLNGTLSVGLGSRRTVAWANKDGTTISAIVTSIGRGQEGAN